MICMKKALTIALCIGLLFCFTSCGKKEKSVTADVQKLTPKASVKIELPADTTAIKKSVDSARVSFAVELLKQQMVNDSGNVHISVGSLNTALGLLSGGAGGQTLNELNNVLLKGVEPQAFDARYKSAVESSITYFDYIDDYTSETRSIKNDPDLFNIWFNSSTVKDVNDEFLKRAESIYKAPVYKANFLGSDLMDSVKERVKNQIGSDNPPEIIDFDTESAMQLVVTDAFSACFMQSADMPCTLPEIIDDFKNADGSVQSSPFLRLKATVAIDSNNTVKARFSLGTPVERGKAVSRYNFYIVQPADGTDLEQVLSDPELYLKKDYMVNAKEQFIEFPSFNISYAADLAPALKKMGLNSIFDNSADFSKISDSSLCFSNMAVSGSLYISSSGIGTTVPEKSLYEKIILPADTSFVKFNRPFIYVIERNNVPLLIGAVKNL